MIEIWKDIENYEGLYQISNFGRVFSKRNNRLMIEHTLRLGYNSVQFSVHQIKNRFTIHRLVALHFIDNPLNLPQVNHIDGTKSNNNVSNLEWCTASENQQHAHNVLNVKTSKGVSKSVGETNANSKLTNDNVMQIRIGLYNGERGMDLAIKYNVCINTISRIKKNRMWKHIQINT